MLIGDRLRAIREAKELSQGDVEERSGLKRSYISRVEHGHTVPSIETLEKLARALEVPLYQLFYDGKKPPKLLYPPRRETAEEIAFGRSRKEALLLNKLSRLLARMRESDRQLLLYIAQKMAGRRAAHARIAPKVGLTRMAP
jgi:transcriptional regulator with XRE-family HTH domain